MSEYTTIRISKETKNELDEIKIHPRSTYEEVIQTLKSIIKEPEVKTQESFNEKIKEKE